ncbi:Carboxypeptidase regulatory-like domain-containing protein [Micromonospora phaseoli]|uniref:Carboxypeptidase regulatory-like domain-containing protein n=2 Tax=Micromonospora phaseoli TaxID=1144548 RepID=A0A1H7BKQ0_9ACTN|nr:carboxypeptidase-like regulatory domain-containing protein [Micromonospora phaseoli]PZV94896.1 carboxypeptidase family protein [Micromonospora phaseoli]SEJ78038.1 Carboxypeptidase regulatory-like domain-containing protein [Micromonospora phaseoli]
MFSGPAPAGQGRSVRKAVDVSTHRRAWQKRAGVVVALIVGALLAVPATPALAANPDVQITNLPNGSLQSGQQTSMTFTVKNNNEVPTAFRISVSTFNGLSCQGDCNVPARLIPAGEEVSITVNLVAGDVAAGQQRSGKVRVSAQAGGDQGADERDMTVRGPNPPPTTQAPQTVRSIAGKVVDQGGDAVPGAYVLLKDSAGKQRDGTTDGNGNFRFTGSSDNPITPGRMDLGASKDDKNAVISFTANAGQSITGRRITLPIAASASPSATPSASESAVPTEDPFEDEFTEEEDTAGESAAAQAPASNEDSGGFGNWLLILLGGLFVAVGVGTIVLLWMKRKENEDPEADGDVPDGAPAGAVPAARGSFAGVDDQTRVVNRVGAAPDPTMVAGPALSNAPTMMHQPVLDDVPPDPYAAPPQPYGAPGGPGGWNGGGYGDEPPGYGAPGYGNAPSSGSGYGNAPSSGSGYGNAPSSGSGYGSAPSSGSGYGNSPPPAGGYGSRDYGAGSGGSDYPPAGAGAGYGERYDEPTGRYKGEETRYPAPADPYATGLYQPEATPGYGQSEPAGYGQSDSTRGYGPGEPAGYGQGEPGYRPGEPAGGYGRNEPTGGGYGQSDPTRGYGQSEPGGYGQSEPAHGYGQGQPGGGYGQEPAGGYGQGPAHQRGGYDSTSYDNAYEQGGYGKGGGYGQEPQQPGGYGQEPPAGGGYGQEPPPGAGYGQSGGGYGQEPPRQRGGYEPGGYGDPTQAGRGRPDGPAPDRGGRRLDWLDD